MIKRLEKFLLKDWVFILLFALTAAAVMGATSMYVTNGTGLTNELYLGEMLKSGMATGDYSEAASFSAGFLIARVLEGPLVGIIDIGGSMMTGIGVGIPALLMSMGLGFLVENFALALLTGLVVGGVIGGIVIAVRKIAPNAAPMGATAVMMGAGNKSGEALGPLVLISAIAYSIPAGIGAIIGAYLFYRYKKPIVGGAILGAMVLGGTLMMFGIGVPVVG